MTISIAIGSFKLVSFVELNLSRCRKIFGDDAPILVADDRSPRSEEIQALADKYGAYYTVGKTPRGHFAGDVQTMVSGLSFCEQHGCEVALKLSMRLIPVTEKFRELIEKPFVDNPWCNILVPGAIKRGQIQNQSQAWYAGFGILSDVYAIRSGSITAKAFKEEYEAGFAKGRMSPDNIVEVFLGRLLAKQFAGASIISDDLANHKLNEPMHFLRKTQCTPLTYKQVAALDGLDGEYDTREHAAISGIDYLSRPWTESVEK